MIAIVDYGMGNLQSVFKALEHLSVESQITDDPAVLMEADGVILPGVGAFGDGMREMRNRGIADAVLKRAKEAAEGGRPFLGVCLGMQILVEEGEEDPEIKGFGVISGKCPRLRRPKGMKIPHMGWNALQIQQSNNPLFEGVEPESYVYFVHSFEVVPDSQEVIAATVDYGGDVSAVLRKGNLYATQFHPEKSQRVGLRMLENFAKLCK